MKDFGYPQTTSTEVLKSYIFNEPIALDIARIPNLGAAAMFMVILLICECSFLLHIFERILVATYSMDFTPLGCTFCA